MKSIQEALETMMPAFRALSVERLSIGDAFGRFLAQNVTARFDLPPFDNSSMDGFAVRARDAGSASKQTPKTLTLRGESRTGGELPPPLVADAAMRIFTGAVLPEGADTIVIQENARVEGSRIEDSRIEGSRIEDSRVEGSRIEDSRIEDARVTIFEAPKTGAWIRRRGSDLAAHATMLPQGTRLGAGEIGILAAQGISAVTVYRRPRVSILSTGDELRDIDEARAPSSIVNSNAYALAAMVRDCGCDPVVLPNVRDDLQATIEALRAGLSCDALITIGGVSVGDYDFVKEAFEAVGISAGFWKVRIKPGKPLIFGMREPVPVVGLPGNPMSAMVTFEALVRPGLRRMSGDPKPFRMLHTVALATDHRHATGRLELVRARVALHQSKLTATPHRLQDSGSLSSWVDIDALLLLAEDRAFYSAGDLVPAILLRDDTGSASSPFE